MIVRDLIEHLRTLDPNAEVGVHSSSEEYDVEYVDGAELLYSGGETGHGVVIVTTVDPEEDDAHYPDEGEPAELERARDGAFCEACGAERGDGYCQSCADDPDRPTTRPAVELLGVRVRLLPDEDPDTSYLDQPEFAERRMAYHRDEFAFVGVRADAEVKVGDVIQTLTSSGLWGIESDSDADYLTTVGREQWENLREVLSAVGLDDAAHRATVDFRPVA